MDIPNKNLEYTLWHFFRSYWNLLMQIIDLPINMVIFYSKLLVYQMYFSHKNRPPPSSLARRNAAHPEKLSGSKSCEAVREIWLKKKGFDPKDRPCWVKTCSDTCGNWTYVPICSLISGRVHVNLLAGNMIVHGFKGFINKDSHHITTRRPHPDQLFRLPSGNIDIAMERSTMFNGKIHYFYGHFQ